MFFYFLREGQECSVSLGILFLYEETLQNNIVQYLFWEMLAYMVPFCGGGENASTTGFLLLFPLPEIQPQAATCQASRTTLSLHSGATFSVRLSLINF